MGATFHFTCPACTYQARVSGREDFGMVAVTTTVACSSCRKLYDVPVGEFGQQTRQPYCPKNRAHPVVVWTHPGACPRCAATLDRPEAPDQLWD